jgi:hypothetical protein
LASLLFSWIGDTSGADGPDEIGFGVNDHQAGGIVAAEPSQVLQVGEAERGAEVFAEIDPVFFWNG